MRSNTYKSLVPLKPRDVPLGMPYLSTCRTSWHAVLNTNGSDSVWAGPGSTENNSALNSRIFELFNAELSSLINQCIGFTQQPSKRELQSLNIGYAAQDGKVKGTALNLTPKCVAPPQLARCRYELARWQSLPRWPFWAMGTVLLPFILIKNSILFSWSSIFLLNLFF